MITTKVNDAYFGYLGSATKKVDLSKVCYKEPQGKSPFTIAYVILAILKSLDFFCDFNDS